MSVSGLATSDGGPAASDGALVTFSGGPTTFDSGPATSSGGLATSSGCPTMPGSWSGDSPVIDSMFSKKENKMFCSEYLTKHIFISSLFLQNFQKTLKKIIN